MRTYPATKVSTSRLVGIAADPTNLTHRTNRFSPSKEVESGRASWTCLSVARTLANELIGQTDRCGAKLARA